MVRVQKNIYMTDKEEEEFSILASIARLYSGGPFYRRIGRFRAFSNPFRFHEENINTVLRVAGELKHGEGLAKFALDLRDLLEEKKKNL